jgi:hypothetical protein
MSSLNRRDGRTKDGSTVLRKTIPLMRRATCYSRPDINTRPANGPQFDSWLAPSKLNLARHRAAPGGHGLACIAIMARRHRGPGIVRPSSWSPGDGEKAFVSVDGMRPARPPRRREVQQTSTAVCRCGYVAGHRERRRRPFIWTTCSTGCSQESFRPGAEGGRIGVGYSSCCASKERLWPKIS